MMVVRLSTRVRLKNTHITGEVFGRFNQDGEAFYWVLWDANQEGNSELCRERDLDSADKRITFDSRRYYSTEWSDRKLQESDRELNQAIYPEPPTRGYPCQRR